MRFWRRYLGRRVDLLGVDFAGKPAPLDSENEFRLVKGHAKLSQLITALDA